jgi:hypothetical protein
MPIDLTCLSGYISNSHVRNNLLDKELKKPYYLDVTVVSVSLAMTWCVLVFTVYQILGLSSDSTVKAVIIISAALAAVFATASLIAVIVHLRKSRESIYREDASHRQRQD